MNDRNYWRRRAEQLEREWQGRCRSEVEKELAAHYRAALKEIADDIAALFGRFSRENSLGYLEARRLIRGAEFKAWRMSLEEYVAAAAVDSAILKELNTLAMRSRISRLEKLYSETLVELQKLGERSEAAIGDFLKTAGRERYLQGLYDLGSVGKLAIPVSKLNPANLEKTLAARWEGGNYSTRIWKNTTKLAKTLKATISQGLHRGLSIDKMSKAIDRDMRAGYKNAERLVRTEMNFVQTRMAADSMSAAGLDEYEFVAVLDHRTTQRCQALDGTTHLIEEMQQGANAPPMHPRCRSTITATFSESLKGGTRTARVGGKSIHVPRDMKYADFKAVYVDKTASLKDWQEKRAEKIGISQGDGLREDLINRVLEKEKARTDAQHRQRQVEAPKSVEDILRGFKTYKLGTKSEAQILEQVNPNFSTGKDEWIRNCQRCVVAWELIHRGCDVTSKPRADDSIGSEGIKLWELNGDNILKDPDARWNFSKFGMKKAMIDAFAEWGDSARVLIRVQWIDGSAHFLTAKKDGDRIIYLDPQVNKVVDINEILKRATARFAHNWFMRIDNRKFTRYIADAVQNREG